MSDATIPAREQRLEDDLAQRIVERKSEFFWVGIAMAIVGVLAILYPAFTTVTVALLIGWVLLLAGFVTFFGAFSMHGTGPFFGQLLLGLLKLGLGVYLLRHPGFGIVAITLLVAAVFMVDGAVKLGFTIEMRQRGGWFWMLLSALVSIAAGLLIAAGLPETSVFVLGLLVGINFLGTGIAFIMLSQSLPGVAAQSGAR